MVERVKTALDELIKTESKKISFAVIEGKSNIIEYSKDWKSEEDLFKIVKFWIDIEKQEKFIEERIKKLEEELKVLKKKEESGDDTIAGRILDAYKLLKNFYNRNLEYPTRIVVSKDTFYVLQCILQVKFK